MSIRMIAAGLLAVACASTPLHAKGNLDDFYANPYDDDAPRPGLHFADLEFAMPTDPPLWSSDPGWEAHHTPARFMTDAVERLNQAVPAGTSAEQAAAVLHKAGARCKAPTVSGMECRYRDTETPWSDTIDHVTWTVTLGLNDGRVASIGVKRDWTRGL